MQSTGLGGERGQVFLSPGPPLLRSMAVPVSVRDVFLDGMEPRLHLEGAEWV